MKTSVPSITPSAGHYTAKRHDAALNALTLPSLNRHRIPRPLQQSSASGQVAVMSDSHTKLLNTPHRSNHPLSQIVPTVEITLGPDPQTLIQRTIAKVSNPALRAFLCSVMAERDVNRVLTLLLDDGRKWQRLPIDRLRSAAETARNRSMLDGRAREVLYTAVLIAGIESLLGETVAPPYDPRDVIRSVVRDALRRLDHQDEYRACALRKCLGWGNDDESDEVGVRESQYAVSRAMHSLRANRIPVRQSQYA